MDDGDVREQIARLEARIEQLSEAAERCRKIMVAAKLVIAAAAVLFLATTLGVIGFDPTAMVAAIAGLIGGVVVLGSNSTTWNQTEAAIASAEAARAELIGKIDLRVVGDGYYDGQPAPLTPR